MKRFLSLLLALTVLVSLVACATEQSETNGVPQGSATGTEEGTEEGTGDAPTTEAPTTTTKKVSPFAGVSYPYKSEGYGRQEDYTPSIMENLTTERVNALSVANASMTVNQLRDICWDFMAFQMNVGWSVDYAFTAVEGNQNLTHKVNTLYGGIPYSSSTFNSPYVFMHYYDSETGKLNVSALKSNSVASALKDSGQKDLVACQIGNQCSASTLWAWARVSNAIRWGGTSNIIPSNGAVILGQKLGEFYSKRYAFVVDYHSQKISTKDILAAAGKEAVYEAYALLQKADGLAYYNGGGHVMMVHHVDVANRRIYVQHQTVRRNDAGGEHPGDFGYYDFEYFYTRGYVPFTIPEFLPKDHPNYSPVEKSEVTCSLTGDSVSVEALLSAQLRSNYMISDVTVTLRRGEEVEKEYFYTTTVNSALFSNQVDGREPISLKHETEEYNLGASTAQYKKYVGCDVSVTVRISTGELLTLFQGTLTA